MQVLLTCIFLNNSREKMYSVKEKSSEKYGGKKVT